MDICFIQHTHSETASRIFDLQLRSYKIEADLIDFEGLPPLQDSKEAIMKSNEVFIGCVYDQQLLGVLSYEETNYKIYINRLMVDPDHFRKGIGQRMLSYLIDAYPEDTIIVQTGAKNKPAVELYKKHGFQPTDEVEVAPGVTITQMECLPTS
ncbi:GNAT family N-acetyltransferase [Halobacillus mangrovi]|uniref:GNAT family N-acetyltransferase n=1 Tax=Halobacillus mangrovi TaxID=402384 RepID=UPI003D99C385